MTAATETVLRERVTEGTTRWAVPTYYDPGTEFATFDEAVAYARSCQTLLEFGGYSRQFVDLRQTRAVGRNGAIRSDEVVLRFEVFPHHVEVVR